MKQLIKVCTILVVFGILILTVMHFAMGRSYGYLEVQQLLLSILMFLSAYKQVQDKGKRDITFWLLIMTGTFILIINLVILQPFF